MGVRVRRPQRAVAVQPGSGVATAVEERHACGDDAREVAVLVPIQSCCQPLSAMLSLDGTNLPLLMSHTGIALPMAGAMTGYRRRPTEARALYVRYLA